MNYGMSTPPPIPPEIPDNTPPPPGPSWPQSPPAGYPPVQSPSPVPAGGTRILLFGCLALLLVAVVAVVLGGLWIGKKAKQFAENPEQVIAQMVVAANPELEIVRIDKAAAQIEIRDRKSGETSTFSFEDVRNGKITMRHSDGTTAEMGAGGIKVQDKDGNQSVLGPGAEAVRLPDWVPAYPGQSTVVLSNRRENDEGVSGAYVFSTPDSIDAASQAYREQLKAAGFKVALNESSADGGKLIMLEASAARAEGVVESVNARFLTQESGTMAQMDFDRRTGAPER